ncbi:MAG: DUF2461 domain-containing protein [Parabacteroides sp.]|nr:DUF2461 domain-containing protein [bacterium]MDY4528917.1 DUF2461 domain-containing protein [Parabacteroides sp.]
MKTVLQFLRDLAQHNDRAWFNEHKERYLAVQQRWNEFCESLIGEIGAFDPDIARLTLRDCTYRIYRDTRFSPDKSPYKTHFGVFLAPGGKKSMHAGYYFHVGTGESNEYPQGHMLAAGNYCYEPKAIQILREDISDGWESFQNEVLAVADPRFVVDQEGALKRVPKGYAPDAPYADWMRLKSYCLVMNVDDDFITQPDLAKRVADLFRTTKPFNDYINRAVDFVHGK